MPKIKVSITQELIDEGERGSAYACPIALYLKSLDYVSVMVDGNDARFTDAAGRTYQAHLPSEAQIFIEEFDESIYTEAFDNTVPGPIEFEIEPVELDDNNWNTVANNG